MTVDNFVTIATLVSSLVALFFALRKQKHDEGKIDADAANLDADTIKTLYSLIREQEKTYKEYKAEQDALYKQLQKDFEDYKASMNSQLADIVNENVKLRRWARKLVAQLEAAGILPTPFEL